MVDSYRVKEIFPTLQGEGYHAGRPAVFVRFTACNLWTGKEQDRMRDAERHEARCPAWCDTDFVGGDGMLEPELVQAIATAAGKIRFVVFTGGEPMLQLRLPLLLELGAAGYEFAIETNGTKEVPGALRDAGLWVCVSPKVAPEQVKQRTGDEIKVVVPAYDPHAYADLSHGFRHRYLQPCDLSRTPLAGQNTTKAAIDYCMENPEWRLSTQTHKVHQLR